MHNNNLIQFNQIAQLSSKLKVYFLRRFYIFEAECAAIHNDSIICLSVVLYYIIIIILCIRPNLFKVCHKLTGLTAYKLIPITAVILIIYSS